MIVEGENRPREAGARYRSGHPFYGDDQISPGGGAEGEDRAVLIGRTSHQYRIVLNGYLDALSSVAQALTEA